MVALFFGSNATDVTQPWRARVASHVVAVVVVSAVFDETMCPLWVPAMTRLESDASIAMVLTSPPSGIAALAFVHDIAEFVVRYKNSPPTQRRPALVPSSTNGATNR